MAFLNWMRHKRDTTQLCNCFWKAVAAASRVWRFLFKNTTLFRSCSQIWIRLSQGKTNICPIQTFFGIFCFWTSSNGFDYVSYSKSEENMGLKKQKQNHTFGYMCLLRVTLYFKKKYKELLLWIRWLKPHAVRLGWKQCAETWTDSTSQGLCTCDNRVVVQESW